MKKYASVVIGALAVGLAVGLPAQLLADVDLQATTMSIKSKCNKVPCKINNLTVILDNNGTEDAGNVKLAYYLSTDTTLSTDSTVSSVTDVLIHEVSTGKIKPGKSKKRTLGGGLLKQVSAVSGNYVIAWVDSKEELTETDEVNNVLVSDPLP